MGESNDGLKFDEENRPIDTLDLRSVWLVAAEESGPRQSPVKILIKHRPLIIFSPEMANNVQGGEQQNLSQTPQSDVFQSLDIVFKQHFRAHDLLYLLLIPQRPCDLIKIFILKPNQTAFMTSSSIRSLLFNNYCWLVNRLFCLLYFRLLFRGKVLVIVFG